MLRKYVFLFLFLFLHVSLLSGCFSHNIAAIPDHKRGGIPQSSGLVPYDSIVVPRGSVVETAFAQIGISYRLGGASPQSGFDCSGLMQWIYKQHGINLPRVTTDQIKSGNGVARGKLRAGDLVFFRVRNAPNGLHVGIYVGNDFFIHSPNSRSNVTTESLNNSYWSKNYYKSRRVMSANAM